LSGAYRGNRRSGKFHDDPRTGSGTAWVRAQVKSARLKAQMSRGKWASGARALKGRGRAEVAKDCTNVGASMAGAWAGG
jgi:predicted alpha/beta-hydrolase family hydrolase